MTVNVVREGKSGSFSIENHEYCDPQDERLKQLNSSMADLGAPENREVVIPVDYYAQEHAFQRKIKDLNGENAFLKLYIQKLTSELRRVLIKHGEISTSIDEDLQISDDSNENVSPPWFYNEECVSPLFVAYDARIKELEMMNDQSNKELSSVIENTEKLCTENESLRKELQGCLEKTIQRSEDFPIISYTSTKGDCSRAAFLSSSEADQLSEMQERLDLLSAENGILMEQNVGQEKEIEELSEEIKDRDKQLLSMNFHFREASETVQKLQECIEMLQTEKLRCEQQLQHQAANLAQNESEKDGLIQQIEATKINLSNQTNKLKEYEKTIDKLKKKMEETSENGATRHQSVTSRLQELTLALDEKDQSLEHLLDVERKMTSELEATRADCEGMLKVMQSMEKQLADYASREETISQIAKESKEKVEEVLLERDQTQSREGANRKEIARLLERRRLDSMEYNKKLENYYMEKKKREQELLERHDERVKKLVNEVATLKCEVERLSRSLQSAEAEKKTLQHSCQVSRDTLTEKFSSFLTRIENAEKLKREAMESELSCKDLLKKKENDYQKLYLEKVECDNSYKDNIIVLERELEMRRSEHREMQKENESLKQELATVSTRLTCLKNENQAKFTSQIESCHHQIQELRNRLLTTDSHLVKEKDQVAHLESTLRKEMDKKNRGHQNQMDHIHAILNSTKQSKEEAEKKNYELYLKITQLNVQVESLNQELSDSDDQLHQLQSLLDDAERRSSEYSSQLSIALGKQQQSIRSEKENRTTMDRLRQEKSRLEREVQSIKNLLEETKKNHHHPYP